ncbi:MAG: tetratricopeptide repeat protein, partial [Myxococcota bacterium]|nr:tetratricopeptide repeat protein [Myxococcota bacterium]
MPSEFDAVEAIEVPYRAAVPQGEWETSSSAWLPLRSPMSSREERLRRIHSYWPTRVTDESSSTRLQRKVSLDAAALYETVGDWSAARFAYLRAIELGEDDFDIWRALARVALQGRDPLLAEAAQLAALESLRESTDAILLVQRRAQVHRDLVALYMLDGRARDAAFALGIAEGLGETKPAVRAWLTRARLPAVFAGVHPTFPTPLSWPEPPELSLTEQGLWMARRVHGVLPSGVRSQLASAVAWTELGPRRNIIITAGLGLLGMLFLLRLIRQRGDLIVAVEYPEELRGIFRIRVGTGKREEPAQPGTARAEILKGGASTHYERHLVNRETQFNRLLS